MHGDGLHNRAVACPRETMNSDDAHYRVLKLIESQSELTQRQMAEALGLTLGKTHYALKALAAAGWVRAERFAESKNKFGYVYLLTPAGFKQRLVMARDLLARKEAEYEALQAEIEALKEEL